MIGSARGKGALGAGARRLMAAAGCWIGWRFISLVHHLPVAMFRLPLKSSIIEAGQGRQIN
jgi:hypothetical protein